MKFIFTIEVDVNLDSPDVKQAAHDLPTDILRALIADDFRRNLPSLLLGELPGGSTMVVLR